MGVCFLLWGFQPLYWFMCTNICGEIDTFFLMACRIVWAAVACLCILKVQGKLPQLKAVFKDRQVLKREIPAALLLFGDWGVYIWAVQHGKVLECSLGYYIQPLVACIVAVCWGLDRFNLTKALSVVLIFGGVWLVTASRSRADLERAAAEAAAGEEPKGA